MADKVIILMLVLFRGNAGNKAYIGLKFKLYTFVAMNKPFAKGNLIPVRDYAATRFNRRGYPVSVQYIYKLIAENKHSGKVLDFDYVDRGKKGIWIRRDSGMVNLD